MPKFYHGTRSSEPVTITAKAYTENLQEIDPEGFYEAIGKSGCPEEAPFGGEFEVSRIGESSFSKSISGSVLALAHACVGDCIIDIYSTDAEPDIDISDCDYDFGELEEVRYRRTVSVKKEMTVRLTKAFNKQVDDCYGEGIDTCSLSCLKDHAQKQIRAGKRTITPMRQADLDVCYAECIGMSVKEVQGHRRRAEEHRREAEARR